MTEIVASPLVEVVLEKISTPLLKGLWLFLGVNNDMKRLKSTLSTISSVLDDAQKRSVHDKQISDWLKKLKTAAFDADDVLDEFEIEKLRSVTIDAKVRDFFSPHNSILFRYKMTHKIKRVTKRLDEIAEERIKFYLVEGSALEENRLTDRETHSFVIVSDVYGRDKDRDEVIRFLVDTDNDKDVSIIPIVGLGGVGKTTLAQLVYNNDRIKNHFEHLGWVCVSEPFDVKMIIENITGHKCDSLEIMQQKLRQKLSDKKFLLVLDDVWNESKVEWERLELLFRGGKYGSKILVTTRSIKVARIMGTVTQPYQLECLSTDDCWTLFKQRAFGLGGQVETPRLVEIGKEIIFTKCGGLPLAAKALGSLMGSIRGEQGWSSIKNSEIWKLPPEYSNNILHVLRLSFNYLPPNVKQCFLYCSLFPKDHEFEKYKLIQMWIAEGFISLSSSLDAEDIGDRYFNILLWRSFFQEEKNFYWSDVCRYKMHDLVHDLACYVAGDESCIVEAGSGCERDVSPECHYISVVNHRNLLEENMIPKSNYKSGNLRTFLPLTVGATVKVQWRMMPRHLRVLQLIGNGIKELPNLIHWTY